MMKAFPIRVVAESPFPAEKAERLQVIESPGEMPVFHMPSRREPAAPEDERAAGEVIGRLLEVLKSHRFGEGDYPRLDLHGLPEGALRVLNETLGAGEVSARLGSLAKVQETAFAGIWRVLKYGPEGELASDSLEACAIPDLILEQARAPDTVEIPPPIAGLMNAPALIREIVDRARRHVETGETHVINLTLLPVTPEDLGYLDAALGRGGVSLLSRGYGNCRITAANLRGVWWVQYFNATENLILNTLEITRIPEVALAAPEDIADSIERLADCLDAMEGD